MEDNLSLDQYEGGLYCYRCVTSQQHSPCLGNSFAQVQLVPNLSFF